MLATILIILGVIIAAVLIYAATRPNDFVVSRSASINAPAEAIFPLINDFKHWPEWSPFEKLDPNMKRTLSGADSGKGAAYAWEGNNKAGKGRMEIVNAVPSSLVSLRLDFEKAVPGQQHRRLHIGAVGSEHDRHLGDARRQAVHRQADGPVHEFRHADRQGLRGRARQSEARHRVIKSNRFNHIKELRRQSSLPSGSNWPPAS